MRAEERICWSKRMYLSWEEAERAALQVMEEAPDGRGPLHAYQCSIDRHHWHYGHDMPKARRRALAATKAGS